MHRHTLTAVTAVAVAALTLTGCGSDTDDASPAPSVSTSVDGSHSADESDDDAGDDAKGHVKITKNGVEDHDVWGPDSYVVHYKITNSGEGEADYYAGLDFLDSKDRVLGSTGITADKVGPGSTAKGDASPLDVEIDKGEMGDIVGARVTEVDRTPTGR